MLRGLDVRKRIACISLSLSVESSKNRKRETEAASSSLRYGCPGTVSKWSSVKS